MSFASEINTLAVVRVTRQIFTSLIWMVGWMSV
jgi:hypothetical protein